MSKCREATLRFAKTAVQARLELLGFCREVGSSLSLANPLRGPLRREAGEQEPRATGKQSTQRSRALDPHVFSPAPAYGYEEKAEDPAPLSVITSQEVKKQGRPSLGQVQYWHAATTHGLRGGNPAAHRPQAAGLRRHFTSFAGAEPKF